MSKSTDELLGHVLDEICFLERQCAAITEEQFMYDEVKQRAFARSLEIIGEAVKMISDEFRSLHPEIDWKSFAGLRDKLIHHYFGVDYALVWDVITHELPGLKTQLLAILPGDTPTNG